MGWYPMLVQLAGRPVVVIGGGGVAERKVAALLEAEARVRVVSPDLTPALRRWAEEGRLVAALREAGEADLDGVFLAVVAGGDDEFRARMIAAAKARGVPVNAAGEGEEGDFITPAVVRRGDLVLAVSASGASPALAARIAAELAERYGPEYESLTRALRAVRREVRERVPDAAERRRLLTAAASEAGAAVLLKTGVLPEGDELLALIRSLPVPGEDGEPGEASDAGQAG
jgi:precorrin-2 dehydrogenase/sirohydrochlorin ferrochelatase